MCLIVVIVVAIVVILLYINHRRKETFLGDKFDYTKAEFPFKNFQTDTGEIIHVVGITAPFRSDNHRKWYEKIKQKGIHFVGVSSYSQFPGHLTNPHEDTYHVDNKDNYESMVSAWLHCFRKPEEYINSGIPMLLWSESDCIDPQSLVPRVRGKEKKYDLIYVCLDDDEERCVEGWQAYNRNWTVAKKCFELLCRHRPDVRVLVVGRTKCKVKWCDGKVKNIPFQSSDKFIRYMEKSRAIFVPNVTDASPRVLCQALCLNLRCLVNRDLVGGWKYVTDKTGEFFTDEHDFLEAFDGMMDKYEFYEPRKWYAKRYGPENSGKPLLEFFKKVFPDVDFGDAHYVCIKW